MNVLDQFLPQNTVVHNLDPRVKIIAVIAMSIIIFHVQTIGLLVSFFILAATAQLARITPGRLFGTLRPVWVFFLWLFVFYLFFSPGKVIPPFSFGPVKMTYNGLYLGLTQICKFLLLVLAGSILTMTTSPSAISSGLERLLRPLKIIGISSHDIAMLVSLALRFFPVLLDQMQQINEAHTARAANFNTNLLNGKIKAVKSLSIPLIMNIFRHSDQLVDAMEARGYHPGERTYLYELSLARFEYITITVIIVLTVLVLILS